MEDRCKDFLQLFDEDEEIQSNINLKDDDDISEIDENNKYIRDEKKKKLKNFQTNYLIKFVEVFLISGIIEM